MKTPLLVFVEIRLRNFFSCSVLFSYSTNVSAMKSCQPTNVDYFTFWNDPPSTNWVATSAHPLPLALFDVGPLSNNLLLGSLLRSTRLGLRNLSA